MITNDGKQLIGKFLLSQAPDFATHIAAGIGPVPLLPDQTLSTNQQNEIKERNNLDFEVFRVPISAKGFIKEDGVEKIVFKAEMPTEQRYQISEVAFFPAAENSVAGSFDSKTLTTFVPTESWVVYSPISSSTITTIADSSQLYNNDGDILANDLAFFVNSNSVIFNEQDRKDRQEQPRFYNRAMLVSGSSSYIDENFSLVGNENYYIENSTLSFNFNQNLPPDEIKFALCVLSTEKANNNNPENVRIIFDFVNNNPVTGLSSPKARAQINLSSTDFVIEEDLVNGRPVGINRYKIITKKLSEFVLDDTFSWANINLLRMYVSVLDDIAVDIDSGVTENGVATLTVNDAYELLDSQSFDVVTDNGNFNRENVYFNSASATANTISYSVSSSASLSASPLSGSVVYRGRTDNYKVLLDGMRIDNVSSQNPLYTMVGYDIIRNDNAYPILKAENSNNYIEYRFGIGVT